MNPTFDTAKFQIVQTWANWDSEKHVVVARVADQDTAEHHADVLTIQFRPWSAFYIVRDV